MKRIFHASLHLTLMLSTSAWLSAGVFAQEIAPPNDLLELDLATLLTLEITPSADASAEGLSVPQFGGQTAAGGRVGVLGNQPAALTPFSITSYTQDYIADQQAHSIGDVLQYDATVRVARGFGNFQQLYMIRGLPVFSDDMAYNGLYGMLPRQYLAANLIERVEILRGANGFLNGALPNDSSLGGAINVMPKRAPLQPLTRIGMGVQSDSQLYLATDLARRSDNGQYGMRLSATKRDGEAAMEEESRNLGMAEVGLDYAGTQLRLSADLGYQNHQLDATQPSITIGNGLAIPNAPDAANSIAPDWTYSDERDWFGTLRAEFDFSANLTGWLAGGLRESEEDSRFAAFLTVNNSNGDYSANRFDVVHEDSVATGEFGLRYHITTGSVQHRFTVAASLFRNDSRNAYAVYDPFNGSIYHRRSIVIPTNLSFKGGELSDPLITQATHTQSFVFADQMTLNNGKLLITWGARRQSIHDKAFNYDSGQQVSHYDGDQITPVLATLYKLNTQLSVYANYIEGLSKGGEAPDSNINGPVNNAGEILEPVQVKQLETGLKYSAGTLGGSISLFKINKPVLGFDSANTFTDTDEQRHRGIEWLMFGEVTRDLKLLGGISLLDTDLSGKHSIGAPKQLANLNLDWRLPSLYGLSLNGHWMYTGKQFADTDNQQTVPSWWRLDLGLRYATSLWQSTHAIFRLRVENATNRNYWASAGGYPGAGYLTLSNPRTVLGSMTLDF